MEGLGVLCGGAAAQPHRRGGESRPLLKVSCLLLGASPHPDGATCRRAARASSGRGCKALRVRIVGSSAPNAAAQSGGAPAPRVEGGRRLHQLLRSERVSDTQTDSLRQCIALVIGQQELLL